ncbi:MAG: type III secretion system translocon subunit SctE [Victivallales bacterium]|nr:type III secretion system translocon subunit SctE [Victivallales bacterium]
MPEVSGIQSRPLATNQTADFAKGLNLSEKGQALVKEVASLLGTERSVRISNTPVASRGETGTVNGATGTPSIDNPDDEKAKEVDLEKLMMYLQLDNAEEQAKLAQERIETQKDTISSGHKERMDKINESLKKMDDAAKASLFNKIFGWLMAAVAVVVAVAACVATGGIAVGAVVGAAIAVGTCILNETGAMEKITKALAEGLEKLGMSKEAAKIVAQVAMAVVILAATIACCGASAGSALSNTLTSAQEMAKTIQQVANATMRVMGLVSIVSNGVGAGLNYAAGKSQADVTETAKILAQLQQQLEESEDELKEILELIQNIFSQLTQILDSETDTQKTIAQQMSQMA